MAIVHSDKEYLKSNILVIKKYLKDELIIELHPKKIYLQHFSKGVVFLGTIIKPYRIYIKHQMKSNFYRKILFWKEVFEKAKYKFSMVSRKKFLASMNSYLGMIKHHNTYKLRKKFATQHLIYFRKSIWLAKDYGKIILKT